MTQPTDTTAPEQTAPATEPADDDETQGTDALGDAGKKALNAMKAERNAATRELKAAQAKLKALEDRDKSDAERTADRLAVAEKTAAEMGQRVVRAELRAAAAGRIDSATLDGFLDYADLSRFLRDGEPDPKAIEAAVAKLAGPGSRRTDFDGGARRTADRPADMNALIRRAAGYQ